MDPQSAFDAIAEVIRAIPRSTAVPIAADESVDGLTSARRLLEIDAADVLVVKPARTGGIGEAHRIAGEGTAAGVPVVLSTLLETGVVGVIFTHV